MKCEIVSNSKRETLRMDKQILVYIPLTEEEKKLFAQNVHNAAWRIEMPR